MTNAQVESPTGFARVLSGDGKEVRLAMQELRLRGTLLPVGARLRVTHVFRSGEKRPLEAIYSFMLPRDATLRRFRMKGEDFEIHSDLKPVREAEKIYEEGIEGGHLSALAKIYRDGVVNLNVGNIRPDETVLIELELLAGVEPRDDGFRFRFPFTLAPAYHAQAKCVLTRPGKGEIELPEDVFGDMVLPTWTEDSRGLHRIGFELNIPIPQGIREISSPSHPVRIQTRSETESVVSLSTEGDVPNRDLVLDVNYQESCKSILAGTDDKGQGRFAAVIPSTDFGSSEQAAGRIIFLLDRSGSMSGTPMQQASRALEACLGAMSAEDQFNIVAFDSTTEMLGHELLLATSDNRDRARQFLRGIDARGGTELLSAIRIAVAHLGRDGGQILVITDGQVMETEAILQCLPKDGVRLHCLGIGSASQDRFLSLLARQTGGLCRFLTPRERIDLAAVELFSSISRPVASGVACTVEGLEGASIAPSSAGVVFSGSPLLVFGSSSGAGEGFLNIHWNRAGEDKSLSVALVISSDRIGETIKLLQGARLITDLEGQMSFAGETLASERREEKRSQSMLEKLSLEYGLASRAMALCAICTRQGDVPGQLPQTRVVPVGMPQDAEFDAYFIDRSPIYRSSLITDRLGHTQYCKIRDFPRKISPMMACPSSPTEEDRNLLIEVSMRLEADGGLSGNDLEERILSSLIALMLFCQEGHTLHQGMFRHHVVRLATFVEKQGLDTLREGRRKLAEAALRAVEQGMAISGDVRNLALRFLLEDKTNKRAAWNELEALAKGIA